MQLTRQRSAQSLLEAVIAIGIIIISTVSATTVVVSTITVGQTSENKIVAANLAREGVEVVRGVRDSNWLRRSQNIINSATGFVFDWDDNVTSSSFLKLGAAGAGNDYVIGYDAIQGLILIPLIESDNEDIVGDDTFMFVQSCAQCSKTTKYHRTINIKNGSETPAGFSAIPYLQVTTTVTWDNHGPKQYVTNERLYDWR